MARNKWVKSLLHIAGWLFFFGMPLLFRLSSRPGPQRPFNPGPPHPEHHFWIYQPLLQNLLLLPVFYLDLYLLFPRLFGRQRYGWFVVVQLGILAVLYTTAIGLARLLSDDFFRHGPGMFMPVFNYLIITSIAFGYYQMQETNRREQWQREKENENLKTELQFLRWQISPHFLFNSLNNLVALVRTGSPQLEPMLIDLSGLMRYMLYETGEKISLQRETEYLQSYIHIQSLRFGNEVKMDVSLEVPDDNRLTIEPMLLIPFVENAFKHGTGLISDPEIKIYLYLKGDVLYFKISNRFQQEPAGTKDDTNGIGLANVRRRLNLLYGDRQQLTISELDHWFTVVLKIDSSK